MCQVFYTSLWVLFCFLDVVGVIENLKCLFTCHLKSALSFRQIAVADLTIINKTDLVTEEELKEVKDTVRSASNILSCLSSPYLGVCRVDMCKVYGFSDFRSINGLVKIIETQRSR